MAQFQNNGKDLPDNKVVSIANKFIKEKELDKLTKNYCIICPIGLIGSGKTTIVKKLARAFGLVRLSNDEMRAFLVKLGYNSDRASEISMLISQKLLAKGIGVAIDADCARPSSIKGLKSEVRKHNVPLVWIKIDVPEKIILQRLDPSNKKRSYRGQEAIDNYFSRKKLHKNIDLPFVYKFKNTDKEALAKQMPIAKQKIKDYLNKWNTK